MNIYYFVGPIKYVYYYTFNSKVTGFSATLLCVEGVGKIHLTVYTDTGHNREIITMAYYVPDITIHILIICRYHNYHEGQGCSLLLEDNGCCFTFTSSSDGGTIYFNYCATNYIPCTLDLSQQFLKSMESIHTFMVLIIRI